MPGPATIPVRAATHADLDALLALEEATFAGDRISRVQWRHHIASATAAVLVSGAPGHVHAAAVVFYRKHARVARLYSLAVDAAWRGAGLGAALLAAAETDAHRRGCHALSLEVRADNTAAIALYERRGYRRTARLAGYYEDGTDGWRYRKVLA